MSCFATSTELRRFRVKGFASRGSTLFYPDALIVHLIDGTYELFRHFYGLRRFNKGVDRPYGAVVGVLKTVLQMIEAAHTYLGVATDHVIESFRNRLWAGYKTGAGIEPALLAQFHPLEEALGAMGIVVWPMIELEADDALASAAHLASGNENVQKVAIWTPDKDLAQCVRDTRVVQIDGRSKTIRDAPGVREKFGVVPAAHPRPARARGRCRRRLPRYSRHRRQECRPAFEPSRRDRKLPSHVLGDRCDLALLFKKLATLRTDARLFNDIKTLHWRGATPAFAAWAERMEAQRLIERCDRVKLRHAALQAVMKA